MQVMGSFEEKVMKEFEKLNEIQRKMEGIESIRARIDDLDAKFVEQLSRLDQVQTKVNLSVNSMGMIHQEQVNVARVLKETSSVRDGDLERLAGEGCFATSPTSSAAVPSTAANFG